MATPAEHYAHTEALLAEIDKASEEARPRIEALLADGAYEQAREAADVMAQMIQLGMAQAQVHATLATVPVFPEKRIVRLGDPLTCDRCGHEHHVGPPDNRCTDPRCDCGAPVFCTCPRLGASPIARTSTDPDCPIHGGT